MAANKTSPIEAVKAAEGATPGAAKKPSAAEKAESASATTKKPTATDKPTATKKAKTTKKAPVAKLAVRPGEKPWTAAQIAEVRAALESDAERLKAEVAAAEAEISQLLREGGEGAGHDQADVGSSTFERDHEMTMARNVRENLALVQAALTRIDEGNYGICESCGKPIGKMRLQAFPRATLCMECKQREERR